MNIPLSLSLSLSVGAHVQDSAYHQDAPSPTYKYGYRVIRKNVVNQKSVTISVF